MSKLRHSLSDASTRAATVVGSWMSLQGAIPNEKILRILKDKSSRKRKRAATGSAEDAGMSDVIEIDIQATEFD